MTKARVEEARRTPIETIIQARRIPLKRSGAELIGRCPQCGGTDRFAVNTKKKVWNCRRCEKGGDVIALVRFLDGVDFPEALNTLTGPAPRKKPRGNGGAHDEGASVLVGEFNYEDETGELLFQVQRFDRRKLDGSPLLGDDGKQKKYFRQRHPDPTQPKQWVNNIDGVRRVLYRLPELLEDLAHNREIILVEGERKADLLRGWNTPATCNPMGAEKWLDEYSAVLRGARICILPDNDEKGRKHLDRVAASLMSADATVRVLDLPGLGPKEDVIDWATAGGTRLRTACA